MGSLGDANRRNNSARNRNLGVALSEKATQRMFDSQCCPGLGVEDVGYDDYLYLSNTTPVDDTCSMQDPFETHLVDPAWETQLVDFDEENQLGDLAGETQLVDLAGETQLVDLAGETQLVDLTEETQLVDFAGETQLVDLAGETQVVDDLDCVKSMPIDFLNNIDTTDQMEHVCETQRLSQNESDNIDGSESVKLEETVDNHPPKQGDRACRTPSDASTIAGHNSGSVSKGFTSIRAASIRASGLAACARGCNGSLCTSGNDKTSIEQNQYKHDNLSIVGSLLESGKQLQNKNNENSEELKNASKGRAAGCTAMRKLFIEDDDVAELGQSEDDVDHTDDTLDMPELPTSENHLAGLSYVDSQEPGELSQAHALEVVDKFLDLNAMELEERFSMRIRNAEKSNVVSGAKGSLNLAKSSILKSTDGEHGIYDWDNTREDDGGGDFFQKKKELFFDKGGIKPRKGRHSNAGSVKPLGNNGDKNEQYTKNKFGGMVYSDSRLMLHKLRPKEDEVFHKNVVKNLDEQLNKVAGHELEEKGTCDDVLDKADIGPDTQMAAEAMENLCFEVQLDVTNDNNVPKNGTHGSEKGRTRKSNKNAPLGNQLTTETPYSTRACVIRQAKRKQEASADANNESSLSSKQSKEMRKKHDTVVGVMEQGKHAGMGSTGRRSAATSQLKGQLDISIPVAKQTRKCTGFNYPTAANDSFDAREEMNELISSRVVRKTRTSARPKNAKIITIDQLRRIGLSALKQSNKKSVGTFGALNNDSIGNGQRKRSQQETLALEHEVEAQSNGTFKRQRVAQKSDTETSTGGAKVNGRLEASPSVKCGISTSACRTPATCVTPVNDISPICMGDEYHKQFSRRGLSRSSLLNEINNLTPASPGLCSGTKELRKRKDITQIKVLFSQHLEEGVVKQQKKILSRLGGAVALYMSEATHFVADEFVRTRNMLEAIACGKRVVTHLWLKSCGQANCLIDEKNYILRDAKKEKEFGFSLPVSLSRACQHPLLQGHKVFITPNTKPGKDILASLVKAVHGLPIERLGRSVLDEEKLPEDLLVLSCEGDYDDCVPFLEKGGAVYSSELVLNGIVKQKLEYERHQLFIDNVKRTRSTIWVKKKNRYIPVTKCKSQNVL